MKPACYGGLIGIGSLLSLILKSPLFTNPSNETKGAIRLFLSVVLSLFVIVLGISIAAGSSAQKMSKEFPLQVIIVIYTPLPLTFIL
jgi:hypothetical protein